MHGDKRELDLDGERAKYTDADYNVVGLKRA